MHQNRRCVSVWPLLLFTCLIAFTLTTPTSIHAQTIPSDAKPTCTVTGSQFASWFRDGHPSLNGVVNPANSVTFSHSSNCAFYQWSKQMFLWLTSPAPSSYGPGGGLIMNSPTFYDVTPPDQNHQRHFVPHVHGGIPILAVRDQKPGPHGLPIVVTKSGQLREFRDAAPGQKPLVRNAKGMRVEVASASRVNGQLKLHDKTGKPVPVATPLRLAPIPLAQAPVLTRFMINGVPVFIDPSGNVVDSEEGQATGDVLLAQNGSLVYYTITVNDVFAYFLTWAKTNRIQPIPQFPTTVAQLNQVINFAKKYGVTFPDPDALAIEIKSSWVEASKLSDPDNYITMEATVPRYNTSSSQVWTPNGQKTVKLALVGMHVVGSAAGHPEMIWSTFEHFGNAPNEVYKYINASNQTITVGRNTSGRWLFASADSKGPFNISHAEVSGSNIVAKNGQPISPSDTLRIMAWGASSNAAPNPEDTSAAASNTEVISIQNSIGGMMPQGDVRDNYFMAGSTWTLNGQAPTTSYGNPGNTGGNGIGTSLISNSTMETYFQPSTTLFTTSLGNCLVCHTAKGVTGKVNADVSHIYKNLQPLNLPPLQTKH